MESPLDCLAANLKSLRVSQGMTQEFLAEKPGVDYKYLQRIEGKDVPGLSIKTLEKPAQALKTEPWALIRPLRKRR